MLTIRPATDADAPVVASIIGRSFVKQVEALAIRRLEYPNYVGFETEADVRRRIAEGVLVMLGHQGDKAVGTVSCYLRAGGPSEVARLAVLPPHRGNDYGRVLMACAENELAAGGAVVAELSIVAQFRRLQSYYEELGYSVHEVRRVQSLPFELLFMQKVLTVGGSRRVAPAG